MTGQEYIQRQIYIVKQQIKGSNMKIMVTDAVTKQQYDYNENKLQTLESIEKSLKALEIIKEKNVSVWGFRNRVFGYQKKQNGNITINDTYEYYLNIFGCYHNGFDIELLTEEEFNLLKEVLKCLK